MSSSSDYRKDREEWSDTAIGSLVDAYTEKFVQLSRGNLRDRDWEDVATIVSERCDEQKAAKSVEQCKNKIDNLKKRYKIECQRLSSGDLPSSHWLWFNKMEQLVGSSSSSKTFLEDDKSSTLGGPAIVSKQIKSTMASLMNAVMLQASLGKLGIEARIHSTLMMQEIAQPYIRRRAIRHLEKGKVAVFGGTGDGIGNPLASTDTAAALRASEFVLFNSLEPGNFSRALYGELETKLALLLTNLGELADSPSPVLNF